MSFGGMGASMSKLISLLIRSAPTAVSMLVAANDIYDKVKKEEARKEEQRKLEEAERDRVERYKSAHPLAFAFRKYFLAIGSLIAKAVGIAGAVAVIAFTIYNPSGAGHLFIRTMFHGLLHHFFHR
jgi:hypothetical protein